MMNRCSTSSTSSTSSIYSISSISSTNLVEPVEHIELNNLKTYKEHLKIGWDTTLLSSLMRVRTNYTHDTVFKVCKRHRLLHPTQTGVGIELTVKGIQYLKWGMSEDSTLAQKKGAKKNERQWNRMKIWRMNKEPFTYKFCRLDPETRQKFDDREVVYKLNEGSDDGELEPVYDAKGRLTKFGNILYQQIIKGEPKNA